MSKPLISSKPELLAPAGSFDSALAALQYGADAIYLGLPQFSARADATNFTPEELTRLAAWLRTLKPLRHLYLTLNTLVKDHELPHLIDTLSLLETLQPDALIVQDLGVAHLVRQYFPSLALHASTQMAVHNTAGARQLRDMGFTRVVLARELSIDQIATITQNSDIEVEVFVHGALCYSISGLCLFSSQLSGRSGNRGRCAYCCREPFTTTQTTTRSFPFSMRDLALIPHLDQLVKAGVHSLKIEGRMKNPLYVACVTDLYRRKLDNNLSPREEAELISDLQTIFSRPWTPLYSVDSAATPDTIIDPVSIGHRGTHIGSVKSLLRDSHGTAWVRFHSNRPLEKHDGIQIEGPSGGKPFGCGIDQLRLADTRQRVISTPANVEVEIALPDHGELPHFPPGSPVLCSASQAVRRRYTLSSIRDSELPGLHPINLTLSLLPAEITAIASLSTNPDITATISLHHNLSPSRQPDKTQAAITRSFSRTGSTTYQLNHLDLSDPHSLFAPPSLLNQLRRQLLATLDENWRTARQKYAESIKERLHLAATPPAPPPLCTSPEFTLKIRLAESPPTSQLLAPFATLVLQLDHSPYPTIKEQINLWLNRVNTQRVVLALPLMNREHELNKLLATVSQLISDGFQLWEVADLATINLLHQYSIHPFSAEWTLYSLNRAAVTELANLGLTRIVLSPEIDLPTLTSLLSSTTLPALELIAYQHTPLYISDTAPCFNTHPEASPDSPLLMQNRRGNEFQLMQIDNRWITIATQPYYTAAVTANLPLETLRLDLTWSPSDTLDQSIIDAVQQRAPLPNTHPANLTRTLV